MSGLAGRLRERVTIERRGPERDALGGAVGAWTQEAVVWAEVAPDGTGSAVSGDAASAAPRWKVTIRARDVTQEHRMVWRGRKLIVREVSADPRRPDRIKVRMEEER